MSAWGPEVMEFGNGRRERATMEVMEGCARVWVRTSPPMKPEEPVRMSFMMRWGVNVVEENEGINGG